MAYQRQHRRGTTSQHGTFTGAEGEITVDTTKKTAVVHDGVAAGGVPLAKENHTHTKSQISDFSEADYATGAEGDLAATAVQPGDIGTAAPLNVATTGDAAVGEVVKGNDTRLTDARTPTAHTHPWSQVTSKPATFPPSTHTHTKSEITDFSDADYATAAQGGKADTALQPATIGETVQGYSAVLQGTTASFTTAKDSKLTNIEAGADVTDTANVTAAGALMDSEVTNLAAVKAFNPASYEPANADILKADTADNLTAAFTSSVPDDGVKSSGTYTPSPATGSQYKRITNGGAFTLAPPALATNTATTLSLFIVNNASAGAITTSGFSRVTGDDFTTVNGDDFLCRIEVYDIGGTEYSFLNVVALQ